MRRESQQKMKAKVVILSQKRALFLIMGNLSSSAFTFFTEQDEVGRREAPSLTIIIVPGTCHWFAHLDQTEPSWKLRIRNRFDAFHFLPGSHISSVEQSYLLSQIRDK